MYMASSDGGATMTPTTTQHMNEDLAPQILATGEAHHLDLFVDWIHGQVEDVRKEVARMAERRDSEFLVEHAADWANRELDRLVVHVAQLAELARN